MQQDLLYRIALTCVPNIGPVQANILLMAFKEAAHIFQARRSTLEKIEGIGSIRAGHIKRFNDFKKVEEELAFLEKYNIRPLTACDPQYPQRLLNCYDPPVILYSKGEVDMNASRIVAVVGTRNNTDYGRQMAEKLISEMASYKIVIVSGLAFGIDAIAHKAAIRQGLPTLGVLAHGLDTIYPPQHSSLAKEMLLQGGLVTEFTRNTKPDKHRFPARNRIVAGMCDAVVVIETGIKGGSIITADLANGYNKDVFALPGRLTDSKSLGCNQLIQTNKAMLLTGAQQLIEAMGWDNNKSSNRVRQKELFIQLSEEEKTVVEILRSKEAVPIDELNFRSNLSSSKVAAALLNLELQGAVTTLPGKMYRLN